MSVLNCADAVNGVVIEAKLLFVSVSFFLLFLIRSSFFSSDAGFVTLPAVFYCKSLNFVRKGIVLVVVADEL